MSATAYTTSVPSSSRLGPHRKHRKQDPCPVCGGTTSYCLTYDDGATLCGRIESDRPAGLGWMHWPHGRPDGWRERLAAMPPPAPRPQMDADLAHWVYTALLARCPLSDAHHTALHARGLSDEQIARHGYGTAPRTQAARLALAAAVADELGQELAGQVPGFIRDTKGRLTLVCGDGEIFIPVRDVQQRIVGIRRRLDDPGEDNKYKWFSLTAEGAISVDGHTVHVAYPAVLRSGRALIVEGEFKANIAADHFGCIVISVPGVNNVNRVVETLAALHAEDVAVAYDKDLKPSTLETVTAADMKLAHILIDAGYQVAQWTWGAEEAKGLDDLLAAGLTPFPIPHPALSASRQDTTPENTEDVAELRRQHALTQAAHRSPNLGAERHTLVDFATMLATHPEDEWVPMPFSRIGDQANIDARTAERHLKAAGIRSTAGEAGVLAGLIEVKLDEVPERVNERTGQIVGGYKAMHVRRLAPVPELLQRIATAPPSAKGKRNGHGGRREPCWKCGATDIERTITDRCAGCGELINQTVRIITGDEETPHVKMTPTPREAETAPDTWSSADTVYRGDNLPPTPPRQDAVRLDRLERARLHLIAVQQKGASTSTPPVEAQRAMDLVAEPSWINAAPDPIEPEMSGDDDCGVNAPSLYDAQEALQFADHAAPEDARRARQDIGAQLERVALSRGRQPVRKPTSQTFIAPDRWAEYAPGAD